MDKGIPDEPRGIQDVYVPATRMSNFAVGRVTGTHPLAAAYFVCLFISPGWKVSEFFLRGNEVILAVKFPKLNRDSSAIAKDKPPTFETNEYIVFGQRSNPPRCSHPLSR